MSKSVPGLIGLCVLTFFVGLGRPAITDSDEAFYAEAAREMLESGDWITPHFNYETRFQKPVLYYWLAATGSLVAGISPMTVRLPAACAGLGLTLLAFACARRWYDERTALLAGAIVAINFGYAFMARQALPDLPLAFFVSLTTWAGMTAVLDARDRPSARRWAILAGLAAGAGMLTKGPLGMLLPGLVILPVVWLEQDSRAERSPAWTRWLGESRPSDWLLSALCSLLVAAPWFVAMGQRHGFAYFEGFFIGDNLERFATDRFNEPRGVFYYVPILAAGLLPWSPFLLLGIRPLWRRVRMRTFASAERRLLLWSLLPLVFFSISVGKQPRYILPLVPPLAILLARTMRTTLDRASARSTTDTTLLVSCGILAGTLLGAIAVAIVRVAPLLDPRAATILPAAAILTAGALVVVIATWWPRSLPAALAAASIVAILSVHYTVLSTSDDEPVERMAAAIAGQKGPFEAQSSYNVFTRNLVFYTRTRQVGVYDDDDVAAFLGRTEPVLLVIPASDLQRIERAHGMRARRIAVEHYFNTAGAKLRTFLWPDPERDLFQVLLVTNR